MGAVLSFVLSYAMFKDYCKKYREVEIKRNEFELETISMERNVKITKYVADEGEIEKEPE
jgi:hypothetical protein